MPAYIVVRLQTDTPEQLKEYQVATMAVVQQFSGKFIARGGTVISLEGPQESRRIVIIEFPALSDAEAFYHSPEYTSARKLRKDIATAEIIAIDGI